MVESGNNDNDEYLDENKELLMLDKEERGLVEAILEKAMKSENGRQFFTEKLDSEYVKIGIHLLRQIKGG
jgi:hypothetical protein